LTADLIKPPGSDRVRVFMVLVTASADALPRKWSPGPLTNKLMGGRNLWEKPTTDLLTAGICRV